jgi:hypothetical protein
MAMFNNQRVLAVSWRMNVGVMAEMGIEFWLVVSTPLKNISQWKGLSHILWKIKNVPNHQPGEVSCMFLGHRRRLLLM